MHTLGISTGSRISTGHFLKNTLHSMGPLKHGNYLKPSLPAMGPLKYGNYLKPSLPAMGSSSLIWAVSAHIGYSSSCSPHFHDHLHKFSPFSKQECHNCMCLFPQKAALVAASAHSFGLPTHTSHHTTRNKCMSRVAACQPTPSTELLQKKKQTFCFIKFSAFRLHFYIV